MALDCLAEGCKGRITTGKPGKQRYWEGDEYACPRCGAQYVIGVTDDYEEDALAFLKLRTPAEGPPPP
jgi:hypothetical protein